MIIDNIKQRLIEMSLNTKNTFFVNNKLEFDIIPWLFLNIMLNFSCIVCSLCTYLKKNIQGIEGLWKRKLPTSKRKMKKNQQRNLSI